MVSSARWQRSMVVLCYVNNAFDVPFSDSARVIRSEKVRIFLFLDTLLIGHISFSQEGRAM